MVCKSCGEKPENTAKDFTKAVVEINNPDKLVLFRKVVVPVSMGTEEDFPASVGKYYNVLLQYEANGDMYLYSSDGIPTKLSSDVSELQHELEQLGIKVDGEILARTEADSALEDSITALDDSLATVAKTGDYDDLTNKPTIGNATLTIKRNNANVGTFTANATTDKSVDISVPTKTSDITNDGADGTSTYVENDELSAVATSGSYNDLLNKPTIGNATLTIKKNNTNVGTFTANATSNKSVNITVPTKTSELTNNGSDNTSTYVEADELATVATTGNYNDLTNKPTIGNGTLTVKRNGTQLGTFKANATSGTTVDISVPTKTSDLTNDGADGTSTFVEADDLPVVDTTYSASSNNAIANSTVTNSLNRDVMTNLTLDTNPSTTTVNLNNTKTNLASPSSTTTTAITLPVASSTQAGVMNSSTFDAVTNNTNNINALLSGAVAVTGLPASPTQAQITSAWQSETGLSSLINRASVYDVTNNKVWTYYTNDATWHAASNTSQVTVNTFTNSSEGVIKGSTNTGQVFAENDGTGSVNGWDTLTGTVANHTSKLATIEQGAEVNVQSNWTQTNTTADDYIKNKPANLVQDANYVHTDNNFTTTLKNKLNGIESGAEVNQNAFSNVSVNGVTVAADAKTDTLTLAAGNNVTLTGDASNDTVTISSTDTNTTYSFANGTNGFTVTPSGGSAQTITVTPSIADATTSTSGLMSATDKAEFDLSNRVQRRLISDGTLIPDNSDLNTIPFLSVGRYVIQGSAHASTLVNCPTTKAFAMEVANSADSVLDNETTGRYIYRVRRITTYDGDEYKQFVHSGNTAGVFTYGNWLRIATTSNIPTVNNATLTIQKNGTNVQTFTANSSEDKTANITVPTAVSELTNDASYATTTQLIDGLATKQNTLTAGNAIDITNDVISADVHPADFFTNTTETITAEGTDTTMQGTALAPFVDVRPKGDTEQATYTGKNLLLATSTGSPVYGILATNNSDGTVTLSGTGTENAVAPFSDTTIDLPAGTYTLSLTESLPVRTLLRDVVSAANTWVIEPGATSVTATTAATTKIRLWFYLTNGVAMNQTVGFQLEAGETASAFEPYVGGTAAPNPEYPQAVQVVTGEQTVKVAGKNILYIPNGTTSRNNTELIVSNGLLRFHNTGATSNVAYGVDNTLRYSNYGTYVAWGNTTLHAGTYTISSHYVSGNTTTTGANNNYLRAVVYTRPVGSTERLTNLVANAEIKTTDENATFTLSEDAEAMVVVYLMASNATVDITFNLQLEKSSIATGYEPYQSQEYEVNLGKNLFNKNDLHIYKGYISGAGVLSQVETDLTTGQDRFIYVECEPNTTYTVTKPLQHTTGNNRFALGTQSVLNISSGQQLSDSWSGGDGTTTTTHTFTTSSDAHYLIIYIGKATDRTNPGGEIQDILDGLQVEKGSTATEYAPYFEPIELCKIGDYQDYIFKSNGNWYKHEVIKKTTLPTSGYSRWTTQPTACMYYQNGVLSDALFQTGAITAVVENLPVKPQVRNMTEYYDTYAQVNKYGFVLKTDTPGIMIQNTDQTAVADFHTWIAANPVVVRYVLATPVDTQITNEALIEQLGALSNANSYRDATHITTASDGYNLPMILTAEAFTNSLAGISKVIDGKQNKLTAGENITIDANNVISATATGNSTITMTDTDPGEGQPLADDNYIAVYGGSGQGGFSRYTANQSIPAATVTTLLPDTTQTPDDGISYANGVAVIQKAGWWILTATVGGAQTAAGYLTVEIAVNNVVVSSASGATTANYTHCRNVIWAGKLSVGDTVKVQVTAQSAMSINKRERGVFCGVLVSED